MLSIRYFKTHGHRQWIVVTRGKGDKRKADRGKGDKIFGDRRRLEFGQ